LDEGNIKRYLSFLADERFFPMKDDFLMMDEIYHCSSIIASEMVALFFSEV
jgi:hypothetical protein